MNIAQNILQKSLRKYFPSCHCCALALPIITPSLPPLPLPPKLQMYSSYFPPRIVDATYWFTAPGYWLVHNVSRWWEETQKQWSGSNRGSVGIFAQTKLSPSNSFSLTTHFRQTNSGNIFNLGMKLQEKVWAKCAKVWYMSSYLSSGKVWQILKKTLSVNELS